MTDQPTAAQRAAAKLYSTQPQPRRSEVSNILVTAHWAYKRMLEYTGLTERDITFNQWAGITLQQRFPKHVRKKRGRKKKGTRRGPRFWRSGTIDAWLVVYGDSIYKRVQERKEKERGEIERKAGSFSLKPDLPEDWTYQIWDKLKDYGCALMWGNRPRVPDDRLYEALKELGFLAE